MIRNVELKVYRGEVSATLIITESSGRQHKTKVSRRLLQEGMSFSATMTPQGIKISDVKKSQFKADGK